MFLVPFRKDQNPVTFAKKATFAEGGMIQAILLLAHSV
jgi:hypothetical protein